MSFVELATPHRRHESVSPAKPPVVLHVIRWLVGGAAQSMLELVRALNAAGRFQARICVLDCPPAEAETVNLPEGTVFLDCPAGDRSAVIRSWRRLRETIRTIDPALIHVHLWPTVTATAVATRGWDLPVIVHIRDSPQSFLQSGWRPAMRRAIYRTALRRLNAQCIAVSNAAADHAVNGLGLSDAPPQVVLNGIDFTRLNLSQSGERELGLQGPFVIGAAGRFASEKGHRYLIDAVSQLCASGVDVQLRIAGTGNLLASYQQQIRQNNLDAFVDLPGRVEDMAAFYSSLDAFVLPSLEREGLPRVLLEAMACGCPCVAADCEGVSDVLSDGETGLVVPRGDSPAIAAALARIRSDATFRSQLGENGRRHAIANFSVERVRDEVEQVYAELIPHR